VRSAAALLTLAVASSGCGVNVEIPTWSMELVEPLDDDGQLTFCPLAGRSLQEETGIDRFLPEPNVVVALSTDEDKDIHTFSSPGLGVPGQAGLSSGLSGLFGGGMIFDLGPIGTAYDDGAPRSPSHSGPRRAAAACSMAAAGPMTRSSCATSTRRRARCCRCRTAASAPARRRC
jgi:hypothetical protein